MAIINTYLTFLGNCEEAFNFYKSVFGGEFTYIGRFGDMPADSKHQMPDEAKDKIMHVSLPISKQTILMGSDTGGEWASSVQVGNNISISITTSTKDEADQLFNGLSASGNVTMPLAVTFWGDYYGMFTDRFEINWMVSFNEINIPE
ncbi:MAG: VOC family protein [Bacteroidota bacterium]|nr:VOC family protein [Bacteroidota bacterium]